jgi:hypothetical protein
MRSKRLFKGSVRTAQPPRLLTKLAYAYASESAHVVANSALSRAAVAVARITCPDGLDAEFVGSHVAKVLRDQAPSVLSDKEHAANRFINQWWKPINQVASILMRGQQLGDDDIKAIVAGCSS